MFPTSPGSGQKRQLWYIDESGRPEKEHHFEGSLTISHPDSYVVEFHRGDETLSDYHRLSELNPSDCPGLEALPETLYVGGDLHLYRCIWLKSLPKKLHVGGDLNLDDCQLLKSLPEELHVGGFILLAGTRIGRVPTHWRSIRSRLFYWRSHWEPAFLDPSTFDPKRILSIRNVELRREAISSIGFERFVKRANAEILDIDEDAGGRRKLLRVRLKRDEDIVCLQVSCPSTEAVYIIRVPPTLQTCRKAAAWIAGFDDPNDFDLLDET